MHDEDVDLFLKFVNYFLTNVSENDKSLSKKSVVTLLKKIFKKSKISGLRDFLRRAKRIEHRPKSADNEFFCFIENRKFTDFYEKLLVYLDSLEVSDLNFINKFFEAISYLDLFPCPVLEIFKDWEKEVNFKKEMKKRSFSGDNRYFQNSIVEISCEKSKKNILENNSTDDKLRAQKSIPEKLNSNKKSIDNQLKIDSHIAKRQILDNNEPGVVYFNTVDSSKKIGSACLDPIGYNNNFINKKDLIIGNQSKNQHPSDIFPVKKRQKITNSEKKIVSSKNEGIINSESVRLDDAKICINSTAGRSPISTHQKDIHQSDQKPASQLTDQKSSSDLSNLIPVYYSSDQIRASHVPKNSPSTLRPERILSSIRALLHQSRPYNIPDPLIQQSPFRFLLDLVAYICLSKNLSSFETGLIQNHCRFYISNFNFIMKYSPVDLFSNNLTKLSFNLLHKKYTCFLRPKLVNSDSFVYSECVLVGYCLYLLSCFFDYFCFCRFILGFICKKRFLKRFIMNKDVLVEGRIESNRCLSDDSLYKNTENCKLKFEHSSMCKSELKHSSSQKSKPTNSSIHKFEFEYSANNTLKTDINKNCDSNFYDSKNYKSKLSISKNRNFKNSKFVNSRNHPLYIENCRNVNSNIENTKSGISENGDSKLEVHENNDSKSNILKSPHSKLKVVQSIPHSLDTDEFSTRDSIFSGCNIKINEFQFNTEFSKCNSYCLNLLSKGHVQEKLMNIDFSSVINHLKAILNSKDYSSLMKCVSISKLFSIFLFVIKNISKNTIDSRYEIRVDPKGAGGSRMYENIQKDTNGAEESSSCIGDSKGSNKAISYEQGSTGDTINPFKKSKDSHLQVPTPNRSKKEKDLAVMNILSSIVNNNQELRGIFLGGYVSSFVLQRVFLLFEFPDMTHEMKSKNIAHNSKNTVRDSQESADLSYADIDLIPFLNHICIDEKNLNNTNKKCNGSRLKWNVSDLKRIMSAFKSDRADSIILKRNSSHRFNLNSYTKDLTLSNHNLSDEHCFNSNRNDLTSPNHKLTHKFHLKSNQNRSNDLNPPLSDLFAFESKNMQSHSLLDELDCLFGMTYFLKRFFTVPLPRVSTNQFLKNKSSKQSSTKKDIRDRDFAVIDGNKKILVDGFLTALSECRANNLKNIENNLDASAISISDKETTNKQVGFVNTDTKAKVPIDDANNSLLNDLTKHEISFSKSRVLYHPVGYIYGFISPISCCISTIKVLIVSSECILKIYDIHSFNLLSVYIHDKEIVDLIISSDDSLLVCVDGNGFFVYCLFEFSLLFFVASENFIVFSEFVGPLRIVSDKGMCDGVELNRVGSGTVEPNQDGPDKVRSDKEEPLKVIFDAGISSGYRLDGEEPSRDKPDVIQSDKGRPNEMGLSSAVSKECMSDEYRSYENEHNMSVSLSKTSRSDLSIKDGSDISINTSTEILLSPVFMRLPLVYFDSSGNFSIKDTAYLIRLSTGCLNSESFDESDCNYGCSCVKRGFHNIKYSSRDDSYTDTSYTKSTYKENPVIHNFDENYSYKDCPCSNVIYSEYLGTYTSAPGGVIEHPQPSRSFAQCSLHTLVTVHSDGQITTYVLSRSGIMSKTVNTLICSSLTNVDIKSVSTSECGSFLVLTTAYDFLLLFCYSIPDKLLILNVNATVQTASFQTRCYNKSIRFNKNISFSSDDMIMDSRNRVHSGSFFSSRPVVSLVCGFESLYFYSFYLFLKKSNVFRKVLSKKGRVIEINGTDNQEGSLQEGLSNSKNFNGNKKNEISSRDLNVGKFHEGDYENSNPNYTLACGSWHRRVVPLDGDFNCLQLVYLQNCVVMHCSDGYLRILNDYVLTIHCLDAHLIVAHPTMDAFLVAGTFNDDMPSQGEFEEIGAESEEDLESEGKQIIIPINESFLDIERNKRLKDPKDIFIDDLRFAYDFLDDLNPANHPLLDPLNHPSEPNQHLSDDTHHFLYPTYTPSDSVFRRVRESLKDYIPQPIIGTNENHIGNNSEQIDTHKKMFVLKKIIPTQQVKNNKASGKTHKAKRQPYNPNGSNPISTSFVDNNESGSEYLRIYDINGELLFNKKYHTKITESHITKDGNSIISCDDAGKIRIYCKYKRKGMYKEQFSKEELQKYFGIFDNEQEVRGNNRELRQKIDKSGWRVWYNIEGEPQRVHSEHYIKYDHAKANTIYKAHMAMPGDNSGEARGGDISSNNIGTIPHSDLSTNNFNINEKIVLDGDNKGTNNQSSIYRNYMGSSRDPAESRLSGCHLSSRIGSSDVSNPKNSSRLSIKKAFSNSYTHREPNKKTFIRNIQKRLPTKDIKAIATTLSPLDLKIKHSNRLKYTKNGYLLFRSKNKKLCVFQKSPKKFYKKLKKAIQKVRKYCDEHTVDAFISEVLVMSDLWDIKQCAEWIIHFENNYSKYPFDEWLNRQGSSIFPYLNRQTGPSGGIHLPFQDEDVSGNHTRHLSSIETKRNPLCQCGQGHSPSEYRQEGPLENISNCQLSGQYSQGYSLGERDQCHSSMNIYTSHPFGRYIPGSFANQHACGHFSADTFHYHDLTRCDHGTTFSGWSGFLSDNLISSAINHPLNIYQSFYRKHRTETKAIHQIKTHFLDKNQFEIKIKNYLKRQAKKRIFYITNNENSTVNSTIMSSSQNDEDTIVSSTQNDEDSIVSSGEHTECSSSESDDRVIQSVSTTSRGRSTNNNRNNMSTRANRLSTSRNRRSANGISTNSLSSSRNSISVNSMSTGRNRRVSNGNNASVNRGGMPNGRNRLTTSRNRSSANSMSSSRNSTNTLRTRRTSSRNSVSTGRNTMPIKRKKNIIDYEESTDSSSTENSTINSESIESTSTQQTTSTESENNETQSTNTKQLEQYMKITTKYKKQSKKKKVKKKSKIRSSIISDSE